MASEEQIKQSPAGEPPDIPEAPPPGLRHTYLRLSWAYIYWCLGILAWALLCVGYFILTHKHDNVIIGLGLGLLMILMVALPAILFGGKTWYKRLGWITVLLLLFAVMFTYPTVAVILGIVKRTGHAPGGSRFWYWLILAIMSVSLHAWTVTLTARAIRLVKKLARGEFGDMDVRVGK